MSYLKLKLPHSYVIDVNGVHKSVHNNHLREFHPSISEVKVNNCATILDPDEAFGRIVSVKIGPRVVGDRLNGDLNSSLGDEYKLVSGHPLPSIKRFVMNVSWYLVILYQVYSVW